MLGDVASLGDIALQSSPLVLAAERRLEVCAPLTGLFPGGGLRRGSTVAVTGASPGVTALALALLAAASAAGSWCALAGAHDLGLLAAAQLGVCLDRLAIVPSPGVQWPAVTAALLDGVEAVVLRPPAPASPAQCRKLSARARERGSVLIVLSPAGGLQSRPGSAGGLQSRPGSAWPERVDVRLAVTAANPRGLSAGHGYFQGRRVEVTATGRGAASGERIVEVWLPGPQGTVSAVAVAGQRRLSDDRRVG